MATPIGNLDDLSQRAIDSLAGADAIAAEDTRVTARLLEHHHVRGKLVAVHEHNERRAADWIVEELARGRNIALVTDAGTPGVSDPGATVVAKVRAAGFRVVPIPGPNAAVTALSAAGIEDGPFLFAGFLPVKAGARRKALGALNRIRHTLVLYEAPHRIVECVEDMAATLGSDRALVIARELTKMFEQIHRCRLGDAATWLRSDADRQRGEFVLLVEAAAVGDEEAVVDWERTLATLLAELPLAQAVKLACRLTGAKKNAVYERALQISRGVNTGRP
ncbi:MAG TPA: 16S rRNA (cytidine(1402)-2'-O)-methyltransferase [Burkholderiales bacterium]|nr:16S rRNA (cytidine(1402)-2'-O)-methyltransferase [Burkholderiales bacterium]